MCVCVRVGVRMCMRACGRACKHACMYVWLVVCLSRVCACVRPSVRAGVHACMYVLLRVFRRTWTDAEELLKEKSFFILSDKFKPTSISCWLLKFFVFCFCFQENVVYIFPAISGWGNQIFWSTRPKLVV